MTDEPDTRTTILLRAQELFEHKGYAAVAVREICEACGVTKPTLYYHFADKEALYVAVLLRRLSGYRELVAPAAPGEPVRARLKRLAAGIFSQMTTNVDVLMRDMENITNPAHHATLGAAFASELYQPIYDAMTAGLAGGELRAGDPALYAKLFLGVVNAFVRPQPKGGKWASQPAPVAWAAVPGDPSARAALVLDLLWAGLAAPGA
ncbi:MAG TPA: TetR/AcrR family transcriptional regulator [Herpetosiphonaceae bacterium]